MIKSKNTPGCYINHACGHPVTCQIQWFDDFKKIGYQWGSLLARKCNVPRANRKPRFFKVRNQNRHLIPAQSLFYHYMLLHSQLFMWSRRRKPISTMSLNIRDYCMVAETERFFSMSDDVKRVCESPLQTSYCIL